MKYELLLERFRSAKRSDNDHAEAFCPVHEADGDRHRRSLSVNRGVNKTLVKCHAGCAIEAIVAAVGLHQADLFDDGEPTAIRPARVQFAPPPTGPISDLQVAQMARALRRDAEAWEWVIDVLRFSPDVVDRLRLGLYVAGGRRWLAYPYRRGRGWSYASCRSLDGQKDFIRVPRGQETTVYGCESLEPGGTAIILEGERDVAAALTIRLPDAVNGGAVVVGMPGVGSVRLAAETLSQQSRVFVFLDSDAAGNSSANELIARLGYERCRRVRLQEFKDLGDLLASKGAEGAREIAVAALHEAEAVAATPPTQTEASRDPLSRLSGTSTLPEVRSALEELALFIASLSAADRAIERERAIGALKRVKAVSAPASLVDCFVAAAPKKTERSGLPLQDETPATEPQDAGLLLGELVAAFERHAVLPRGASVVLAAWAMHTWVLEAATFTPRLALTSPTKRCGKTLVLDLLQESCRRSILSANLSSAVVFRAIESMRPTLLIDEADTFLEGNEELRGILNAGFRWDGTVLRCDGDDNEPRAFRCFSPVAIAAIGTLPGTIVDRSLTLRLVRKSRTDNVVRFDRRTREALARLRPRLARWAEDNAATLRTLEPPLPESLNDRQRDICEPLLAIADLASGEWPTRVRDAVVTLCAASDSESADQRERLLAAVWSLYDHETEFLTLKEIVRQLLADEDSEWHAVGRGEKPLSTRVLGKWLAPFGLTSRQPRSSGRERGYYRTDLVPVVENYASARQGLGNDRVTVSVSDNFAESHANAVATATVSSAATVPITVPKNGRESSVDTQTRSAHLPSRAEMNIEKAAAILGGKVIAITPLANGSPDQLPLSVINQQKGGDK